MSNLSGLADALSDYAGHNTESDTEERNVSGYVMWCINGMATGLAKEFDEVLEEYDRLCNGIQRWYYERLKIDIVQDDTKKDPAESPENENDGARKTDDEIVQDISELDNLDRHELVQMAKDLLDQTPTPIVKHYIPVLKRHIRTMINDENTSNNQDQDNDDVQQDTRGFAEHLRDALTEEIDADQGKDTPFATTNLTSDETELLTIYRRLTPVNRPGLLRGVKKLYDEETGEPIPDKDEEHKRILKEYEGSDDEADKGYYDKMNKMWCIVLDARLLVRSALKNLDTITNEPGTIDHDDVFAAAESLRCGLVRLDVAVELE